jgi:hypothetical protein
MSEGILARRGLAGSGKRPFPLPLPRSRGRRRRGPRASLPALGGRVVECARPLHLPRDGGSRERRRPRQLGPTISPVGPAQFGQDGHPWATVRPLRRAVDHYVWTEKGISGVGEEIVARDVRDTREGVERYR